MLQKYVQLIFESMSSIILGACRRDMWDICGISLDVRDTVHSWNYQTKHDDAKYRMKLKL